METSRELQGSPSTMNKTLLGQKVATGLCNGETTSCPGLLKAERFPLAQNFPLESWDFPGQTMMVGFPRNGSD